MDQVCERLCTLHYSLRTKATYVEWVSPFRILSWHASSGGNGPDEGGVFFEPSDSRGCGFCVDAELGEECIAIFVLSDFVCPVAMAGWGKTNTKRDERLPVVLTKREMAAVLSHTSGVTGLRLMESVRLRVMDVDFERGEIVFHEGKGSKNRVTILPTSLLEPLQSHLVTVMSLHQRGPNIGGRGVISPLDG